MKQISIAGILKWLMCAVVVATAITFAGNRAYGFEYSDRAQVPDGPLFRAILSTVRLRPERAVAPSPSPAPAASPSLAPGESQIP